MHIKNKTYCVNDIYRLESIPYTGRGCCAAILDTGIYPHPDLADHISYFHDFVNGRKNKTVITREPSTSTTRIRFFCSVTSKYKSAARKSTGYQPLPQ